MAAAFTRLSVLVLLFNNNSPPRRNLIFSSLSRHSSLARGLRPIAPQPSLDGDGDSDDFPAPKKSRNELKREARQAVRWGMDLANFSTAQINRILRIAALDREVLDALMLVKRMGPDVREGRRRQFNYIGKLLRTAQPELMDALIQASKDGDERMLLSLSGSMDLSTEIVEVANYDNDEANDIEYEDKDPYDNESEKYAAIAARWFDGLVEKDPSITNEVYSVNTVDFDRQELRRLIRKLHSVQEVRLVEKSGAENDAMMINANKPLVCFLRTLAKKVMAAQDGVASEGVEK